MDRAVRADPPVPCRQRHTNPGLLGRTVRLLRHCHNDHNSCARSLMSRFRTDRGSISLIAVGWSDDRHAPLSRDTLLSPSTSNPAAPWPWTTLPSTVRCRFPAALRRSSPVLSTSEPPAPSAASRHHQAMSHGRRPRTCACASSTSLCAATSTPCEASPNGTQYRIAELRGTANQQPCSGQFAPEVDNAAVHADVRTRVLHLQGRRGIALRRDPRTRQRPLRLPARRSRRLPGPGR